MKQSMLTENTAGRSVPNVLRDVCMHLLRCLFITPKIKQFQKTPKKLEMTPLSTLFRTIGFKKQKVNKISAEKKKEK